MIEALIGLCVPEVFELPSVIEVDFQQIADADLCHIIHNVLVIEK